MKKSLLAATLALGILAPSCIGPNNAFNSLYHWNRNMNENKWVNEAVHVGMLIVPVYAIAYMGDILIFNSMEWWGSENPISPPGN